VTDGLGKRPNDAIESAGKEKRRLVRAEERRRRWTAIVSDRPLRAMLEQLDATYASADNETWP